MEIAEKIRILGDAAKYDACASSASSRKAEPGSRVGNAVACGICHSFTEDGRCVSLFKVLLSNRCSFDCKYCSNSAGCLKKPASFSPEELAGSFIQLYMRNYVEGLFLSSAVERDPDTTTEKMLDAVRLVRDRYRFRGYVHFKVLPGTSRHLIEQAAEISDRLSINLEAPNRSRLSEISSVKDFKVDISRRQAWIKRLRLHSGQTTQLVVGSSGETDLEILRTIDWEYRNIGLRRGYYSAFVPVPKTPLGSSRPTPLMREHRLFNVDFMLRKYGMKLRDFQPIMEEGMLPKEDPKVALARSSFERPVEVNEAPREELLRVPGIGPISASRIVSARRFGKISGIRKLHIMGVVLKRALPFISIDGKHQKRLEVA